MVALALSAGAASASRLSASEPTELTFRGSTAHDHFVFYGQDGEYRAGAAEQPFVVDPSCDPRGQERTYDVFACPTSTTDVIAILGGPSEYHPAGPNEEEDYDNTFTAARTPKVSFDVRGGRGADLISVYDGLARVSAGANDDLVRVGDASDTVILGDGSDRVSAGGGNDKLYAGDFSATGDPVRESPARYDFFDCGGGTDAVFAGPEDGVGSDCERVTIVKPAPGVEKIGGVAIKRLARGSRAARVALVCVTQAICVGDLRLRAGRVTLASGDYRVDPGRTVHVQATLTAAARKLLRSRRRLKVRVIARPDDGSMASARTLTLR